jgi:hypothetical protein
MKKSAILFVLVLGLAGVIAAVPAFAGSMVLYDNTGNWTIGVGVYPDNGGAGINSFQGISNSFTLSQSAIVTGVDFPIWVIIGGTMTNVDWSISTDPFSGYLATGPDTSMNGTVFISDYNVSISRLDLSPDYEIYEESISIPSLSLGAGTYWFELQNSVTSGNVLNDAYWDLSNGPSIEKGGYGTSIGLSETFQILGEEETPVPEPSSFLLLGSGLAGLVGLIKRKLMA